MTKKQIAAVIGAILAIASGVGLGVNGQVTAGGLEARVQKLEGQVIEVRVQVTEIDKRLERIEAKVDRLLERGR